ncbi:hypothetical protein AGMMS49992_08210 [Clostridia bacterium]|nr:hypothetical protein AGMMS49992_08210 [Clostridia bacterium]
MEAIYDIPDLLIQTLISISDPDICRRFLTDILTVNEVNAIAQRLAVAKMLHDGKTYIEVVRESGVSSATISRVNRSLAYGVDGYKLVLETMFGPTPPKTKHTETKGIDKS